MKISIKTCALRHNFFFIAPRALISRGIAGGRPSRYGSMIQNTLRVFLLSSSSMSALTGSFTCAMKIIAAMM